MKALLPGERVLVVGTSTRGVPEEQKALISFFQSTSACPSLTTRPAPYVRPHRAQPRPGGFDWPTLAQQISQRFITSGQLDKVVRSPLTEPHRPVQRSPAARTRCRSRHHVVEKLSPWPGGRPGDAQVRQDACCCEVAGKRAGGLHKGK
jgi:hypothetical protein